MLNLKKILVCNFPENYRFFRKISSFPENFQTNIFFRFSTIFYLYGKIFGNFGRVLSEIRFFKKYKAAVARASSSDRLSVLTRERFEKSIHTFERLNRLLCMSAMLYHYEIARATEVYTEP